MPHKIWKHDKHIILRNVIFMNVLIFYHYKQIWN